MNFQTSFGLRRRSLDSDDVDRSGRGERELLFTERSGGRWVTGVWSTVELVPAPFLSSARLRRHSTWPHGFLRSTRTALRARRRSIVGMAKHGQSLQDPNVNSSPFKDGRSISAINAAPGADVLEQHEPDRCRNPTTTCGSPTCSNNPCRPFVTLSRELPGGTTPAAGFDVKQNPVTVEHSGLAQDLAGAAAASFFGVPV